MKPIEDRLRKLASNQDFWLQANDEVLDILIEAADTIAELDKLVAKIYQKHLTSNKKASRIKAS